MIIIQLYAQSILSPSHQGIVRHMTPNNKKNVKCEVRPDNRRALFNRHADPQVGKLPEEFKVGLIKTFWNRVY